MQQPTTQELYDALLSTDIQIDKVQVCAQLRSYIVYLSQQTENWPCAIVPGLTVEQLQPFISECNYRRTEAGTNVTFQTWVWQSAVVSGMKFWLRATVFETKIRKSAPDCKTGIRENATIYGTEDRINVTVFSKLKFEKMQNALKNEIQNGATVYRTEIPRSATILRNWDTCGLQLLTML